MKNISGIAAMDHTSSVSIGVASPERMRAWSHGEVKNPETINYRSFKPEKGGLFCERIFGPMKDWECNCGKYKRQKHKGVVCDRCGVEVTYARVRRERMGHLELAVPVSHVWFYKCLPSRIGMLLDMAPRTLEKVLYYEEWIVIDKGNTPLQEKQLLTDEEYREKREEYGDAFKVGMGAEAIEQLLAQLDLPALKKKLTDVLNDNQETDGSKARGVSKSQRKKTAKRARLVEGFLDNDMNPCWMILHVLPVIPPELRPLVPLDGGRFATSDLNDLYRRVINRNNRLRHLLQLKTPEVIIRNEKRMLQEAVDALLDNGRHGRPVTGTGNRNLKSLTDMLKGKQGRFRQNLLGKRVDYSGRSVIVVGPELRLNQCGLPKEMALTLFEPFIMRRLKERGHVHTVRNAKKWIEQRRKEVWDILDEVIKGHPILLNRAPTLHRLSIQAFDPVLIEGQAIRLHPLVCTAFNADFDGDQMAVHVPLSNEAQLEAKLIMLAPNNIFSPASGKPITTPSQDITLGVYFLCYENKKLKAKFKAQAPSEQLWFNDYHEALRAFDAKSITMHDFFNLRNPFYGKDTAWGALAKDDRFIVTTIGRCIFNEIWPEQMGFYNGSVGKKELGAMIKDCYESVGRVGLIQVLDLLKDLGYEYATWAGFSIGVTDLVVPKEKKALIEAAQKEVNNIKRQYDDGVITKQERYNRCIDIWTNVNKELTNYLFHVLEENEGRDEINPVYAMLDSGARGSKDQVRQLAGMRGLMAKPSGEIIERPIIANFREGLSVLEYFLSSHGARKGLADTALKTADSGYMTRRLVDVAHDVICVEDDCGTVNGIWARPIRQGNEARLPLEDRIIGRFSADGVRDPISRKQLVGINEEITAPVAKRIAQLGINQVRIRSVLTCESKRGVCCKCYGRNLATGEMPKEGDPLGIIAAQSIGEPGTQLTMRTFHLGGTAFASSSEAYYNAVKGGILRLQEAEPVLTEGGKYIVLNSNGRVVIEGEDGVELESYELVPGATLQKAEGSVIEPGERFVEWDAFNVPVITRHSGRVEFRDLTEGITMKREVDPVSSHEETVVMEHSDDVHPQLVIVDDSKKAQAGDDAAVLDFYALPKGAHIVVTEGEKVKKGQVLAKTPRQNIRTKDITGGLPRVAELFEARRPKEAAEIARIDGVVEFDKPVKGRRNIKVHDTESGMVIEHVIPAGKTIVVYNGEYVKKGVPLTDGAAVLHEMLEVCGPQELQEYLVNEVQQVYRAQGVEINDKHIEIIVRQMMRRVRITNPGNTPFLYGELVDKRKYEEENQRVISMGGKAAESQQMLQGITKAALATDSFISAASFQDTTRILTEAATMGKVDNLVGFKENVIMGHLIPAGTGYHTVQRVKLELRPAEDDSRETAEPDAVAQESKEQKDIAGLRKFLDG
ncbi:MAG: DNA-directed RNA polymerase subunit beta' [Lentisphaerae bacterium]|nr:DNA-directed RNA polymerase subunit beta' [Lentisphaerota bacterium]